MSYQMLRRLLHYCPETGQFTWRFDEKVYAGVKGKPAGSLKKNGYIQICYKRKKYYAQRLAVLYMTKREAQHQVRHLNSNHSDNTWSNLQDREAGYYTL
jgi:hypothetical protein